MHSQTLQALRAEIEAVTTFQVALNRIAHAVDADALSVWDGPRPEDADDVAGDDGSFSREAVMELRSRSGSSLAARYREVERAILGRAALESLLRSTVATATGGVVTPDGPPAGDVLDALARSGALRMDWANAAAAQVKELLELHAQIPTPRPTVPATPKAKGLPETKRPAVTAKKKKPAAKKKPVKKPVKTKVATKTSTKAKRPAPKKKPVARKKKR